MLFPPLVLLERTFSKAHVPAFAQGSVIAVEAVFCQLPKHGFFRKLLNKQTVKQIRLSYKSIFIWIFYKKTFSKAHTIVSLVES